MKKTMISIIVILIAFVSTSEINAQKHRAGTFTDSRDGKVYKTIKIGEQTWMAENLAFEAKAKGSGCWIYNNDNSYLKKAGRLYDWETAKRVCPSGWHLPSDAEWTILIDGLGGEDIAGAKLKSTTGWLSNNGNNSSGFSARPAGYKQHNSNDFYAPKARTLWWSSTESTASIWIRRIDYEEDKIKRICNLGTFGFSVRCIKDK